MSIGKKLHIIEVVVILLKLWKTNPPQIGDTLQGDLSIPYFRWHKTSI